jgi:hypothetical protein
MKGDDEGMLMHARNVASIIPQEVHLKLLSLPEFDWGTQGKNPRERLRHKLTDNINFVGVYLTTLSISEFMWRRWYNTES